MENLLNAEVIKMAAASPFGMLSLMCLILGVIALTLFQNAPVRAKVLVFVLLFLGVGGFGYSVISKQSGEQAPTASREFFIGRWQVNQEIGSMTGTVATNYLDNGTFEGYQLAVAGNQGQRLAESGAWRFEVLSSRTFRLSLQYDNGRSPFTGTFKIIDRNHIHNIVANYDAVRVE